MLSVHVRRVDEEILLMHNVVKKFHYLYKALVQREQLKEELEGMRHRMEQHAEEMSTKMAAEREIVRKESKLERDELNSKVKFGIGNKGHQLIIFFKDVLKNILKDDKSNLENTNRVNLIVCSPIYFPAFKNRRTKVFVKNS